MKPRLLPLLLLAFSSLGASDRVWFGTESKGAAGGICSAELSDAGKLSAPVLAASASQPGFLVQSPDGKFVFAATSEDDFKSSGRGGVAAFSVGENGALSAINKVATGSNGTCHITISPDGRHVVVAHYSGGCFTVHPVGADGKVGPASQTVQHTGSGPNPRRQTKAFTHAANFDPSGKFLMVNDLGCDKVFVYAWDASTGTATPAGTPAAVVPPGSGPRHFAFHPSKPFGYAVNEMLLTVTPFSWTEGKLQPLETVSALAPDVTRNEAWSAAQICASRDGRFLYASIRMENHLAVFSLEDAGKPKLVESVPAGVDTPRNFNLSPSGQWLLAAGQKSNDVAVLALDAKSGRLTQTGQKISVPSPICVLFARK